MPETTSKPYECVGLQIIHSFRVEPRPKDPTDPKRYPVLPGIYVVVREDESHDFDLIYVGTTDHRSLSACFPDHWTKEGGKGKCFENNTDYGAWTHWGFNRENSDKRQKFLRDDILGKNPTPCNDPDPSDGLRLT